MAETQTKVGQRGTIAVGSRGTRFRELDGFRGIAAVAVVLSHLAGGFDSKYPEGEHFPYPMGWGAYGVQLFFLVSGFVILMSARSSGNARRFAFSRFIRLYPAYWIALTVSIIVSTLVVVPSVPTDWKTRVANYTMFQRFALIDNVDEVYWTLAIELQFYLIIIALLLVFRGRLYDRVVFAFGTGWVCLSLVTALLIRPYTLGVDRQLVDTPVKIGQNLLVTEWAPFFVAGMFCYLARKNGKYWGWAVGALVSAISVTMIMQGVSYGLPIVGIVAVFGIVTFVQETPLLRWGPIQWFGKISYSLYIGHLVTGTATQAYLLNYMNRLPAMVLTFGVVTLWARLLHELGEKRASTVLRAKLLPKQFRAATVPRQKREYS